MLFFLTQVLKKIIKTVSGAIELEKTWSPHIVSLDIYQSRENYHWGLRIRVNKTILKNNYRTEMTWLQDLK